MDKISSIIPSNARVTTVDMKSSGTARSGMPGFGRDTLPTKDFDRLHHPETVNGTANAIERHKELMSQRDTAKDPRAEIVTKMTEKFFNSKQKEEELPEIHNPEKFEAMAGLNLEPTKPTSGAGPIRVPQSRSEQMSMAAAGAEANEGEEDAPVLGHRLDVMA